MLHAYNGLTKDQIGVSWICVRFYPLARTQGDTRPCGPRIHQNSGHSAMGDVRVEINDRGRLDVRINDLPDDAAIGFPAFTPDEHLTMRGAAFGPSGGNKLTEILVSIAAPVTDATPYGRKALDLRAPAHYAKIAGETSNVWIKLEHDLSAVEGVHDVDKAAEVLDRHQSGG